MRSFRSILAPMLFLGIITVGCADDPVDPDTIDITAFVGTWDWIVTNISSTCGTEPGWDAPVVIARVGNSDTDVTLTSAWRADDPTPFPTDGTVSGNTLTVSNVTYTEDGGTLVATHTVTVQNNGNLAGTETWTWTNASGTCAGGTAQVLALRVS